MSHSPGPPWHRTSGLPRPDSVTQSPHPSSATARLLTAPVLLTAFRWARPASSAKRQSLTMSRRKGGSRKDKRRHAPQQRPVVLTTGSRSGPCGSWWSRASRWRALVAPPRAAPPGCPAAASTSTFSGCRTALAAGAGTAGPACKILARSSAIAASHSARRDGGRERCAR
jgi:hypothetical protein